MFGIADKEYNPAIQERVNNIEKELGKEVVMIRPFSINFQKYNFSLTISKSKPFNILEEFIAKIALSDMEQDVTNQKISDMLGIDLLFVDSSVKKLVQAGMISKDNLPGIKITPLGKKQFERGFVLTTEGRETIPAYYNPEVESLYTTLDEATSEEGLSIPLYGENKDSRLTQEKLLGKVVELAKLQGKELEKSQINQFVSHFDAIQPLNDFKSANYLEYWVYDVAEKSVSPRVWDIQNNKFSDDISQYVKSNHILEPEEFELIVQMEEGKRVKETRKLYEQKVRIERDEDATQEEKLHFKDVYKVLRKDEIKKELNQAMNEVDKYLFINSPWMNDDVIDSAFLSKLKRIVDRGGHVFITWGINETLEGELAQLERQSVKNQTKKEITLNVIKMLEGLIGPNGLSSVHVIFIGNTHEKEIVFDNQAHWLGSFNFLSYRGDRRVRKESVTIVKAPDFSEAILEAKKDRESEVFVALKDINIESPDFLKQVNTLINLETTGFEIEKLLRHTILENNNPTKNMKQKYNLALLLYKDSKFEDLYFELVNNLMAEGELVKQIATMMYQFRQGGKRELFAKFCEKYQEVLLGEGVIDQIGNIIDKEIKKKNSVNKLVFVEI